ncbi:GIY-YIG nuclease family protein [Nostoc sp. FACHB-152]|uniref:GIY-YIG nuclease family protein n=1 Tax=unclassified Nostoc TaxID=2593658 RepID=UPI00168488CD|nr:MULTISPECIES: GIY-YIG nuclease family protein [unclassified Nostoc]MBD2448045.1 GIY-YIG nuclease family protein [Nostoc sp. FACHB-152]MBD2466152.1 GIY-YIG nuclease family protein [Nostoc sp. FACHB-145]
MNPGYIYALENRSFASHILKIGRTTREPDIRAKEIYRGASGVPEPFNIAFACKVADCEIAEKTIHRKFNAYRSNKDREFFIIPIGVAKKVILSVCQEVNKVFGFSTDELVVIDIPMIDILEDCAEDSCEVVMLSMSSVVYSPIGTSLLSDEQKERVEIIAEIFADVFPRTVDAWIMDLSRDHNPEKEIEIWENIATAFLKIAEVQFFSQDQKKEVFYLLFLRSMMSASKVLEQFKLKNFSRKTAKEILSKYKLAPKPIVIR